MLLLLDRNHVLLSHAYSQEISQVSSTHQSPHLDILESANSRFVEYHFHLTSNKLPSSLTCLLVFTAEWAIARIQAEAGQKLATLRLQQDITTAERSKDTTIASPDSVISSDSNHPSFHKNRFPEISIVIGRYHCTSAKHLGTLRLDTDGLSFETTLSDKGNWALSYEDLQSMQKVRHEFLLWLRCFKITC
jgi:hypothetical protein